MAMLPATHFKFQRACNKFYAELSERGILACALGGLIMGIGLTLSGSVSNHTHFFCIRTITDRPS